MSSSAKSIRFLSAAAAMAAALVPAAAQARNWSKSEAILGGRQSALQAILAQQQGIQPAKTAPLQPASFSGPPRAIPAFLEEPASRPARIDSGRPDVFGSVALRIGATRLNARWDRVEGARLTGAAARYADRIGELDGIEQLEAVNRYVNQRVRFVEDDRQYGRPDVWAAAAETLNRGQGDCEDYAIAKFQMLRRAGFDDRDLYLVIVKDLISRRDHAVLVVRSGGRMHVLDNGTDRLLDSDEVRDYRPVLTFAANGTWTHGYRVQRAPVELASAETEAPLPALAQSSPQRSWSASPLALSTGFNR